MGDLSKNFSRREFECRCGCGFDTVDHELILVLETLRELFGPIRITSGCRCQPHNWAEAGARDSQHVAGKAADIVAVHLRSDQQGAVALYLESEYQGQYGIGRYVGRTHIDVRAEMARW